MIDIILDVAAAQLSIICTKAGTSGLKALLNRVEIKKSQYYDNISDIWDSDIEDYSKIRVNGVLSKFFPLLIGPPKMKRNLHLEYRRSIPANISEESKIIIDSYLAYTAGQMVWRFNQCNSNIVCLGLYNCIARNSIPIFVDRDYYNKNVENMFIKAGNDYSIEVSIDGVISRLQENFIDDFLNSYKMQMSGFIKSNILNKDRPVYGILVDGKKTRISYKNKATYLDGDIWVAVELDGKQFFVNRFINLSDANDLQKEKLMLKKDVEKYLTGGKIIFQFDQIEKIVQGAQSVTINDILESDR